MYNRDHMAIFRHEPGPAPLIWNFNNTSRKLKVTQQHQAIAAQIAKRKLDDYCSCDCFISLFAFGRLSNGARWMADESHGNRKQSRVFFCLWMALISVERSNYSSAYWRKTMLDTDYGLNDFISRLDTSGRRRNEEKKIDAWLFFVSGIYAFMEKNIKFTFYRYVMCRPSGCFEST